MVSKREKISTIVVFLVIWSVIFVVLDVGVGYVVSNTPLTWELLFICAMGAIYGWIYRLSDRARRTE